MLTEIDTNSVDTFLAAREAELIGKWVSEPEILLDADQLNVAIPLFRKLALEYIEAGMPLECAVMGAELGALATVTHTRKVIAACERIGLTNFTPEISTKLSRLGRSIKYQTCAEIAFFIASKLGVAQEEITAVELQLAFDGEPSYDTAALKVFQYFSRLGASGSRHS